MPTYGNGGEYTTGRSIILKGSDFSFASLDDKYIYLSGWNEDNFMITSFSVILLTTEHAIPCNIFARSIFHGDYSQVFRVNL